MRDLGVNLDSKLGFSGHINKLVRSAYFKTIQIIKLIKSKNWKHWVNIFKVYIRPILEFALEVYLL